jgi:DNA-binding transcriptional MerR regulator
MSRRHPDEHPDRDESPSYSLDELSREADVTPRTIRYYIAEGLLPPPESIGRNARYGQEHLDRLRFIGQLKAQFLPLKEIRTRIRSMSPEAISRAATVQERRALASRRPPRASSAEDYVASVLREASPAYEARAMERPPRPAMQPPPQDRSWKRIRISDDAELLITDDAWDRRGHKLGSALEWIRRMLNE